MKIENHKFETIKFRGKSHKYFIHEIGLPRFNELDSYSVVWNGHYVNYFETARLALCKYYGFDMKILSDLGLYLPVSSYSLNIRNPVFAQDRISVAVTPLTLEESSVMDFFHLLIVDKDIRAYGTVRHAAMSKESGSIFLKLPDEILEVLKPMRQF